TTRSRPTETSCTPSPPQLLQPSEDSMTMQSVQTKRTLPIAGSKAKADEIDIEAELRAFEEAERERLGIKAERRQWADNMLNLTMKKAEKKNVTLLISGLTAAQDFLCEGALKGLGYNVKYFGMS